MGGGFGTDTNLASYRFVMVLGSVCVCLSIEERRRECGGRGKEREEGDSIHQGFFADQHKREEEEDDDEEEEEASGTSREEPHHKSLFYGMKEVDEASGTILMREEMKS